MSITVDIEDAHDYRCYFNFDGKVINCVGINPKQFIKGFWISGEQISDERAGKIYWINPAKIEYIEAESDEVLSLGEDIKDQPND